jgi:hypothetical protein
MLIFMSLGLLALVFAFLLKAEDRKKGMASNCRIFRNSFAFICFCFFDIFFIL